MTKLLEQRHIRIVSGVLVASLGLYWLGARFLLPIVLVVLIYRHMPVPKVLSSAVGRAFAAFVLNLAMIQLASVVQLLVWPGSNFMFIAPVYAALVVMMLLVVGRAYEAPRSLLSRSDAVGLIIYVLGMLPFASIMTGQATIQKIVSIGGLQSPDAGHHYEFVNEMAHDQHLDTSGYPKSFHLSLAFMQDAVGKTQDRLSWSMNVVMFFAQYVLMSLLLPLSLGYLLMAWLGGMVKDTLRRSHAVVAAVALGLPLCLIILWPFIEHGFLNYFFTVTALALGLLYLGEAVSAKAKPNDPYGIVGLVWLFAASLSWPLITPAVLLMLGLLVWPMRRKDARKYLSKQYAPLLILVAIQIVPLLVQLRGQGSTSVNDAGDLRVFSAMLLLVGVVILWVGLRSTGERARKLLESFFIPFVLLSGGILLMQLFMFGEARYFAIKVSLLVEAFLLVMAVAVTVAAWARSGAGLARGVVALLAPLMVVTAMAATTTTPLQDVRNLFRDQSGQGKPGFYDHDVYLYARLGKEGKIDNFNSTVLHYHADSGKLYSHAFLPQWAQFVKYPRDDLGLAARDCHRLVFRDITYTEGTPSDQRALVAQVRSCATIAHRAGQPYYIITDEEALPHVKAIIGGSTDITYVSQ